MTWNAWCGASDTTMAPKDAATTATAPATPAAQANPFLVQSTLPFQAPHFDLIKDEHYAAAFEEGMKQQRADGSWPPSSEKATDVARQTAFALLVLERATIPTAYGPPPTTGVEPRTSRGRSRRYAADSEPRW